MTDLKTILTELGPIEVDEGDSVLGLEWVDEKECDCPVIYRDKNGVQADETFATHIVTGELMRRLGEGGLNIYRETGSRWKVQFIHDGDWVDGGWHPTLLAALYAAYREIEK